MNSRKNFLHAEKQKYDSSVVEREDEGDKK